MNVLALCVILMTPSNACDNSNNTAAKLNNHDVNNTTIQRGAGILPPKKREEN